VKSRWLDLFQAVFYHIAFNKNGFSQDIGLIRPEGTESCLIEEKEGF
jgi:hypothetical protein